MESTGKLINVMRDIMSGKLNITFQIDNEPIGELNDLATLDKVDITAKKHRNKRSLDANAMLWACLSDIAKAMTPPADRWSVYLNMLKSYGKYTYICVKPNMVEAVKAQWRECEVVGKININGDDAVQMLCFFGSSTYDSKEFSVLLEGVVSEMKILGLTPPPSKEMQMALERWERL
jgi:hypothetical protein